MTGDPPDRLRVLVVASDRDRADALRATLAGSSAGWDLDVATPDDCARLAGERADAVLMDLRGAGAPGLDALSRTTEAFPVLPVVVLTRGAEEEMGAAALRRGAQEHVADDAADPG